MKRNNMRFVRQAFRLLMNAPRGQPIERRLLGRWQIHHDERVFDRVDRTNEDHCGCCGDLLKEYAKKQDRDQKALSSQSDVSEK